VASGQVLRIDPRTGDRTVLASLSPGLDNVTFVGERLFVSTFTGQVTEILGDGQTRATLPDGLTWPLDLTVGADGTLYVSDGTYLLAYQPGSGLQTLGMLFSPGYPGYIRGMSAVADDAFVVTTGLGQISRYHPASSTSEILAEGFEVLYGVAVAPNGLIVAADLGAGKVVSVDSGKVEELATGLQQPISVAFGPDGTCLVAEAGAGRIVAVTGAGVDTVVDGLDTPHGILVLGNQLYIVDVGAKTLINVDLDSKARRTIGRNLPVGAPPGVTPKPLLGIQPFSGPQGPFTGIAAGPDGTIYVSADADGSVLAFRGER
jgi:DNA-binding beta-propeller fold protein YncE